MKRWAALTAIAWLLIGPEVALADTVPTSPSACTTAIASASQINGFALFEGSIACAQEGRQKDANFLIILGQIRAMTDLSILSPADDQNTAKAGQLYSQLYYQFGGSALRRSIRRRRG
jgi:hypothetical protein